MELLGNQVRRLVSSRSVSILIIVSSFLLFSVFILSSCSTASFGPALQGDVDAEIAAAVEATVEVAVAETVAALDGSASSGNENSTQTEQGDAASSIDAGESNAQQAEDQLAAVQVPELTAEEAELAQWVTANTRHYIGDPQAPIVFIEFSDFQ